MHRPIHQVLLIQNRLIFEEYRARILLLMIKLVLLKRTVS